LASLVKSILIEPEEYLAAKANITQSAKASFGFVNVVEKEYAGKRVQQICLKYAMIVGSMLQS